MPDPEKLSAEQLAVLDSLDAQAEPLCCVTSLPHAAEVALRCKGCQNPVLVCRHHAGLYAGYNLAKSIEGLLTGQVWAVGCANCHRQAETLEDLVEVVNL